MPINPIPPQGKLWRGIDLLHDPRRIEDDRLQLSQNLVPTQTGVLKKRDSLQFVSNNQASPQDVCNAAFMPVSSTSPYVYVVVTRSIASNAKTTLIAVKADGTTVSNPLPLAVGTHYPGFAAFLQTLIVGVGPPYNGSWAVQIDPTLAQVFAYINFKAAVSIGGGGATTFGPPSNFGCTAPQVVAAYSDRMAYANFGPGFENYLVFSDSLSKSTINPPSLIPFVVAAPGGGPFSRAILIGGARDGDPIVAAQEITLTSIGGQPQRALLVLKTNSAYLITGEPNQTTDNPSTLPPFGNLTVSKIAFNCGCAAAETVVSTPYGVFWAGPDDVWMFPFGQVPIRVGSLIRPALLRTPTAHRYRWHAAYFNGFYRLAIDSPSLAINDDASCGEQYWLDLRHGVPQGGEGTDEAQTAVWWGPQIFSVVNASIVQGTRNMVLDTRGNATTALYGFDVILVSGPALSLGQVQYDVPGNIDMTWGPGITAGSTEVLKVEILADLRTKEYGVENATLDKIVKGVLANVWVDLDCTLQADINMDGGAVLDIIQKPVAQFGFQLSVDSLDTNRITRQTQGIQFFANLATRDLGKTFFLRLYDPSGLVAKNAQDSNGGGFTVIQGVNDQFAFSVFQDPNTFQFVATLQPGFYGNVQAFLTQLTSAMNTVIFPTFLGSVFFTNAWTPFVTITVTGTTSWTALFQTGVPGRSTRKIGAVLGFDTSADQPSSARVLTSVAPVRQWAVPIWEISSMAVRSATIGRTPV